MDKIKKLKLNKEVIANLNKVEMNQIKGGGMYDDNYTYLGCGGGGDNTTISCPMLCGGSGGIGSNKCQPTPTSGGCGPTQTSGCATGDCAPRATWDGCVYSRDYCGTQSVGCVYTDPYW